MYHAREIARNPLCPSIGNRATLTITRSRREHQTDALPLYALEIAAQRIAELRPCETFFLFHPLFNRGQRIRHHGQRAAVHADRMQPGAPGNILACFKRPAHQQVHNQFRRYLADMIDMQVYARSRHLNRPRHMPQEQLIEMFRALRG